MRKVRLSSLSSAGSRMRVRIIASGRGKGGGDRGMRVVRIITGIQEQGWGFPRERAALQYTVLSANSLWPVPTAEAGRRGERELGDCQGWGDVGKHNGIEVWSNDSIIVTPRHEVWNAEAWTIHRVWVKTVSPESYSAIS